MPAKSTIASKRSLISLRRIPSRVPFRYTFSRPVSSGWNPVPTSSRLPTRPPSSIRPVVGAVIRLMILSNVLLPAPLRPMIPTTSPQFTSKLTSWSASKCSRTFLVLDSLTFLITASAAVRAWSSRV